MTVDKINRTKVINSLKGLVVFVVAVAAIVVVVVATSVQRFHYPFFLADLDYFGLAAFWIAAAVAFVFLIISARQSVCIWIGACC